VQCYSWWVVADIITIHDCLLSLVVVQAIPGFNGLDEDLRSTFLNLIQELMIRNRRAWKYKSDTNYHSPIELEVACQRLAIVQNREPSAIRKFVGFVSQGF
jgi:hypothetical protein